jgi:sugar lactone lactonase YvrE
MRLDQPRAVEITREKKGRSVEKFVAEPCTTDRYFLGECCRWDEVRGELYWVDVHEGHFFRATADHTTIDVVHRYDLEGNVSALAPLVDRNDGWIVAMNQSLYLLSESGQLREVAQLEEDAVMLLNDGAADPWGSFWVGSLAADEEPNRGSVYRFGPSSGVQRMFGGATVSNGIGWSLDRTTLYYVDSGPGTITSYDVGGHGEISGPRLFAHFDTATEGTPDGLCIDSEGFLWVAVWGGYEVRRYAPTGELVARVSVSTAQPSCCAIGGANGTTLYITTAQEDLPASKLDNEPEAGRLFAVNVDVKGRPLDPYRPFQQLSSDGA